MVGDDVAISKIDVTSHPDDDVTTNNMHAQLEILQQFLILARVIPGKTHLSLEPQHSHRLVGTVPGE